MEKINNDITHYLTKEKTIQTVFTKRHDSQTSLTPT